MKLLTIDIETSPCLAHVWGLWQQNVALVQLRESTELMCFAAKWHNERQIQFVSGHGMLQTAHDLLSEADAVVTWNGDQFDLKHFNREFIEHGMGIPAPFVSIDLLKTVRKQFKFPSNKLDYVASRLLGQKKTSHTGHQLWIDCMAGDERAWRLMERYNKQDVRITERLYDVLLPWIPNHPHVPLHDGYADLECCPSCGSSKYQRRGFAYTSVSKYPRFSCLSCGRWFKGTARTGGATRR